MMRASTFCLNTLVAGAVLSVVAACTQSQLDQANKNIVQGAATADVVMTTTQKLMCQAQTAANAASAAAAIVGDQASAANAAKASAVAGVGCVWQTVPAPTPVVAPAAVVAPAPAQ